MKKILKWILKLKKAILFRMTNYLLISIMGVFIAKVFSNLTNDFMHGDYSEIGKNIVYIVLTILCTCVIIPVLQYKEANLMEREGAEADKAIFGDFLKCDISIGPEESGTYMNILWHDFPMYRMNLIFFCSSLGAGIVTTVVAVSMIAHYSLIFALFSMLFCLCAVIIPLGYQKKLEGKKNIFFGARDNVTEALKSILSNYEYIRLENQKGILDNVLLTRQEKQVHYVQDYQKSNIRLNYMNSVVMLMGEAAIYVCGCLMINKNILGYHNLIFVILMTSVTKKGISWLIEAVQCVHNIRSAGERIQFLDDIIHEENENIGEFCNVTVQNVTFSYDKSKTMCYPETTIEQNQVYLLQGKNGAGKSTFFKLLLGEYKNYTGEITINNLDIRRIAKKNLYQIFGYIPQNPVLFRMSVKDNIVFGNSNIDQAQYERLMEGFKLKDLEDRMVEFNGDGVSGGEAQSIVIVRELLRNASIYLVDEPFNTLDSDRKTAFCNYINEESDSTFLIISHQDLPIHRTIKNIVLK